MSKMKEYLLEKESEEKLNVPDSWRLRGDNQEPEKKLITKIKVLTLHNQIHKFVSDCVIKSMKDEAFGFSERPVRSEKEIYKEIYK
jgi:hypothetical protein